MYGIAAQSGCLHKKHNSKKHNKEWHSDKPLSFGLRPKGHRLRCQPGQASHAAADVLASELLKRNASHRSKEREQTLINLPE